MKLDRYNPELQAHLRRLMIFDELYIEGVLSMPKAKKSNIITFIPRQNSNKCAIFKPIGHKTILQFRRK